MVTRFVLEEHVKHCSAATWIAQNGDLRLMLGGVCVLRIIKEHGTLQLQPLMLDEMERLQELGIQVADNVASADGRFISESERQAHARK